MKAQLDDLAKNKPFLLKAATQQQPGGYGQPPQALGYGTPPGGGLSGHHEGRTAATDYAREHPGIYGDALRRLAGAEL